MRARFLLLAGAAFALAGCATVPAEPVIAAEEPVSAEPQDVAVPTDENTSEGLTENDWGGEVPQSAPSEDVDEGGLGDIG